MTLLVAEMGFASAFGPGLETALAAQIAQERCLQRNPGFVGADFLEQICAFQDADDVDTLETALARLVGQAVADLLERLGSVAPLTVDCILCLPEPSGEDATDADLLTEIAQAIDAQLKTALAGSALGVASTRLVTGAQTGPGRVLESMFARGADRAYLMICADSFSDRNRLNALLDQGRLFGDELLAYGLIPGEAAAALLILPEALKVNEPLGHISAAATSVEEVGELDNADSLYTGLSDCALAALDGIGARRRPIGQFVTDFNNGRYRAGEGAYCLHRLSAEYLAENTGPSYPALDFGDVGAAYFGAAIAQILAGAVTIEHPVHALILASTTRSKRRASIVFQTNPVRVFGMYEAPEDAPEETPAHAAEENA